MAATTSRSEHRDYLGEPAPGTEPRQVHGAETRKPLHTLGLHCQGSDLGSSLHWHCDLGFVLGMHFRGPEP